MDTSRRGLHPMSGSVARWAGRAWRRWALALPLLALAALVPAGAGGAAGTAAAANTWVPTGALQTNRSYHTATLLRDGRVLAAAGSASECCLYFDSAELYDPATGTWATTGPLRTARNEQTATLLQDGRVLVAGGFGAIGSLANATLTSTELYSPTTGVWTPATAMHISRAGHSATLLPNGKVLVAGGSTENAFSTSSAELYDPATGIWILTGAMTTPRWRQTATLLPDGMVLVAGGLGPTNNTLASAELYNPATGTWSGTGSMAGARNEQTATLLQDGRVLVAGGCDDPSCGRALQSAEIYDTATGAWRPTGALRSARGQHTATLLPSGQVLVAGGCCDVGQSSLTLAELYNPATGVWSLTGPMSAPRSAHTATLLPNGHVLVAGGCLNAVTCGGVSAAEVYTPGLGPLALITPPALAFGAQPVNASSLPQTIMVTNTGTLPLTVLSATLSGPNSADFQAAAPCLGVPLAPGGGCAIPVTFMPPAEGTRAAILTVVTDAPSGPYTISLGGVGTGPSAWTPAGPLVASRAQQTATLLQNGQVLSAGGGASQLYDPATRAWTARGAMVVVRSGHTAPLLRDGRVLVAGGCCGDTSALSSAELYDPTSGAWSPTGSMHAVRQAHTATLLRDGRVLVTGGCNFACGPGTTSAELYDPITGVWTVTNAMTAPRAFHTATLLRDGRVLVVGGCCVVTRSAEVYDPGTGLFTPTGSLYVARSDQTATLLRNGTVLVAGGDTESCTIEGCGSPALTETELYNPASGRWAIGASMKGARGYHTATLLGTGQVLVVGGCGDGSNCFTPLSSAEIYAPADGRWVTTSPMSTTRFNAAATLLPNGQVLVAGGDCCRSAELYTAPLLVASSTVVTPGQTIIVAGLFFPAPDFAGQETVRVYWDNVAGLPLSTPSLDPRGSFSAAVAVPPSGGGVHTLIAVAQISQVATTKAVLVR